MENVFSMFSLKDKVALITGASQGIGEAIALTYARAGARVAICSRRMEKISKVAAKISGEGGDALPVEANVSNAEHRRRLVQSVMDWGGRVDVLVNNAGANPSFGPLAEVSDSVWEKVFEMNVKASFMISQLVFHASMKDRGGVIVNVSSVAGSKTTKNINLYNVAKAALNHLTRCLASEWGHQGIRVNALAPGIIRTAFSRALWDRPEGDQIFSGFPIPRIGGVDDIVGAALFLASDASAYITGAILTIDGGQLIR